MQEGREGLRRELGRKLIHHSPMSRTRAENTRSESKGRIPSVLNPSQPNRLQNVWGNRGLPLANKNSYPIPLSLHINDNNYVFSPKART